MNQSNLQLINEMYERLMRNEVQSDFDKIGFFNVGYWKGVDSVEHAQINLIETLLAFFTETCGTVLDVACGKGASTKFLTKYFDPEKITGINISESQLQVCRTIAPECSFQLMDATNMSFPDESFENVLCIEAAQHFMTRYKFFEEAYRVLKPGGRLAIHDIVFHEYDRLGSVEENIPKDLWPKENCLPDLYAYEESLRKIGFRYVRVEDITPFSMSAAMTHLARKREREFNRTRSYRSLENTTRMLSSISPWASNNCKWCFAFVIK